jgi:hypothetical protein
MEHCPTCEKRVAILKAVAAEVQKMIDKIQAREDMSYSDWLQTLGSGIISPAEELLNAVKDDFDLE